MVTPAGTGDGIAVEHLPDIFERFYRAMPLAPSSPPTARHHGGHRHRVYRQLARRANH